MIISEMEIRLMADLARLGRDMAAVRTTVSGAMGDVEKSVKRAADSLKDQLAGALAVGAIVAFVKMTIDAVDALTDLSTRTNITVEDLAGLTYAAQLSGSSLEGITGSISKLTVNMGKDAAKYAALGVTATEPLEAFKQLADIFKSIQDPQQRAAFGAEAFGKSWQEAAVLLNEGSAGIEALMQRGQALSGVTAQMSADAAAFNDRLDELRAVAGGLGTRLAVDLLPLLTMLSEDALAASKNVDSLGDSFNPLTETLKALVVFGGNVAYVFQTIAKEIGGIAAQITLYYEGVFKLLKLDFSGFASSMKQAFGEGGIGDIMKLEAEASRKAIDEWSERVINAGKAAKVVMDGVEFPDPYGIDSKIADENAARVAAFLKFDEMQAAAKKAAGEAAAAAKKEQDTYTGLITTLATRIALAKAELAAGMSLTDAQKASITLDQEIINGKTILNKKHLESVQASMAAAAAYDKQIASQKAVRDADDAGKKDVASIYEQIAAVEQQVRTYNMLPAAITAVAIADLEAQRAALSGFDGSAATVDMINQKIAALQRLQEVQQQATLLDTGSDVTKAKELLDIMTSLDEATKDAAAGMAASFGTVGTAIGGLTTALSGYSRAQAAIAAELAAATDGAKGDSTKIAAANASAAQKGAQLQIKSYGDMAGAAKGFFKENSAGYKVMQSTEKAFRAYEMAMALESMVKKIFFKEGEVAANLALNATKVTGEATATAASTGLAATEASAWGITAVVKALASLPFPANLAAGAATLAAVVAIGASLMGGGGGGGSVSVSEQRQAANGTGSVLGMPDAKSESIANSLEIMQKTSGLGLAHTISMDSSLKKLVAGIEGLGSILVQSKELTKALAATSDSSGGVFGGMMNSIFGGKKTVEDAGLYTKAATLGTINAGGLSASSYLDTKTTGGWFSSDKYKTQMVALGDEANSQLSMVITGLYTTIKNDADLIGVGGDAFSQRLQSFVVDLGKISFKDLNGEERQAALEAALSKLGDDMAKFGVQGLERYQKVGEGYLETLSRVANDYLQVTDVLTVLGKSFNVTGIAAVALSEDLIAAAGDLETLTSGTSYFVENFLSEAQRMEPIVKSVQSALDSMGLGSIKTVEQFAAEVLKVGDGVAAGTEGSAELYAQLLALAPTFKTAADYTKALAEAAGEYSIVAKTAAERASELKDLQQQYDDLTLSAAAKRAKERLEVDPANRAMYDQVAARQDLAAAYDLESSALKSVVTNQRAYQQSLLTYNASLQLGSLSTLTPMQKMIEAQKQYEELLARSKAGDTAAQSQLTSAASAYLTADQVIKSSSGAYAVDAARVQAELAALAAQVGSQASDAELQLAALEKSAGALINLNDTAVSTHDAILALIGAVVSSSASSANKIADATTAAAKQSVYADQLKATVK